VSASRLRIFKRTLSVEIFSRRRVTRSVRLTIAAGVRVSCTFEGTTQAPRALSFPIVAKQQAWRPPTRRDGTRLKKIPAPVWSRDLSLDRALGW
ncbi:MAG: hypothetical protein KDE01_09245, partial [Caldilineaceae bacterium]|nr:hypothetical protein [Caldilineaceae bacterium]